jgi:hypothetical protein
LLDRDVGCHTFRDWPIYVHAWHAARPVSSRNAPHPDMRGVRRLYRVLLSAPAGYPSKETPMLAEHMHHCHHFLTVIIPHLLYIWL